MSPTDVEINEAKNEVSAKEQIRKELEAKKKKIMKNIRGRNHEFCGLTLREKYRETYGLNLIANENYTNPFTAYYLGSMMSNASSADPCNFERSNRRNDSAKIEKVAQNYCLRAFNLNPDVWGCNVQPYSRSLANLAVYLALCKSIELMMNIDKTSNFSHVLPAHGATSKNPCVTSVFFDGIACKIDENCEEVYTQLEINARLLKPKVITVAASFYPKVIDFKHISEIAKNNDAYFFMDMSEISGLVAAEIIPSPFEYSDFVTTATDMNLRGPHAAVIFYRKSIFKSDQEIACKIEDRINQAVSRLHSSSDCVMVSIAAAMKDVSTPEFVEYQEFLMKNTEKLGKALRERHYNVILNKNMHFVVVDLCQTGINADLAAKVFDEINISCTTCYVPRDDDLLHGIKFGMGPLTSRKDVWSNEEIDAIANFIDKGLFISKKIYCTGTTTGKNIDDILTSDVGILKEIEVLKMQIGVMGYHLPIAYSNLEFKPII